MEKWCPYCNKTNEIEHIKTNEILDVKGKKIEVPVEFYKCKDCGNEFEVLKSGYDPIAVAYRIYRDRKKMVQPEQIKNFRLTYDLSQKELSDLLGWGGATLSRYENGALQDATHDKILQLIINAPLNLLELIEKAPGAVPDEKRKTIADKIRNTAGVFGNLTEKLLFSYESDIYSGLKKLNLDKLLNMVLIFCENGVFKTKLNKLLFYADFKYFKEFGVSISGARYAHILYGPSPNDYEYLYKIFENNGFISLQEISFPDGNTGEKIYPAGKGADILNSDELKVVCEINKYFRSFSSNDIKDFSHLEEGYKNTRDGDLISYEYARYLRV